MNPTQNEKSGKYLTFTLADEKYGATISSIREIIGMMKIISLPGHGGHVKGLINLRDSVIPVVDLRTYFNLPEVTYSDRTCIIIADIQYGHKVINIGLVVDMVSEVVTIEMDQIENVHSLGQARTSGLWGMAKTENDIVKLLDFSQLFAENSPQHLPQAA